MGINLELYRKQLHQKTEYLQANVMLMAEK